MKKQSHRSRKEAELVTVRIEIAVLPEFYEILQKAARKDGLTARRWSAERLADLLGVAKEKALPPYYGFGRPRKNQPRKSLTAQ